MIDEAKFILKISPYLERFKDKGAGGYNFRCPVCGDGKTTFKTRAWFLPKDGSHVFYCHNCSASMSLSSFMKDRFPDVYTEYVFDKMVSKSGEEGLKFVPKLKKNINYTSHNFVKELLRPCVVNSDAMEYLRSRKIPEKSFENIFVIEDFSELKGLEKYKTSVLHKEPRIILPIYNSDGLINGIISRAIYKDSYKRYINLQFYESPSIYGLYDSDGDYKLNLNKKIYVVEGAFDSLFVENCVAVNTSNLLRVKRSFSVNMLKYLDIVFVPDNDKRNTEIIAIYKKIIDEKESIVILPSKIKNKDINDIVLNEKNLDVMKLLKENTFKGLSATMKFNQWKR